MPSVSKSAKSHTTAARQLSELSLAVPQVLSHRLTRFALAGAAPKASDRREFRAMVAEKQQAFVESWWAMGLETLRQQQHLALALSSGLSPRAAVNPLAAAAQQARLSLRPLRAGRSGWPPCSPPPSAGR